MSSEEHAVRLDESRIQSALREMIEDQVAGVIRHHKRPEVRSDKSVITIKLTIIPDDKGEAYHYGLACTTALAPAPAYKGTFYGLIRDGKPEVVELDPKQPGLF